MKKLKSKEESYDRVYLDLLDMMALWEESGVNEAEMIFAGLTLFIKAAIDLAPTRRAAFGMLHASIENALKEDE